MKIKQLETGSYKIDFTVNGVRRRERYKTFTLAKERERQILNSKEVQLYDKPAQKIQKAITLKECYWQYQKWNELNNRLKSTTANRHKIFYKNVFGWLVSKNIVYVSQLNKNVFDDYVQFRKKQGVSLCTIKKEFNFLSAILNHAVRRDTIIKNTIAGYFDKIKIVSNVPEVPSVSDIQKIFDNLPDTDTRKAFYFVLAHGCRFSEFATLDNSDIQNDFIRFWRVQKGGYERSCQLTELPFEYNLNNLAFTFHNRKWRKENLCRRIQKACRSAGVPEIVTHTLRHAHATFELLKGTNVYELMKNCGWKSFSVVQKYVSISPRYKLKKDGSYLPEWRGSILLIFAMPWQLLGSFWNLTWQKNEVKSRNIRVFNWLERRPVTPEVESSSLFTRASNKSPHKQELMGAFFILCRANFQLVILMQIIFNKNYKL